jgi:hypothetical protein
MRGELLAIAFLIQTISPVLGGSTETKIPVDLHAHRAEIRELLLRRTPIGSTAPDVLKIVATKLSRSGNGSPKIENGPATGPATKGSRLRGVKKIRVFLGQYYDHPEVIFLTAPMLMEKEVTAQWAFDDHDRLIEIFVDKASEVY